MYGLTEVNLSSVSLSPLPQPQNLFQDSETSYGSTQLLKFHPISGKRHITEDSATVLVPFYELHVMGMSLKSPPKMSISPHAIL